MFRRINTRKTPKHTRAQGLLRPLLAVAALAALGGGLAPAARAAGFVYQQHTLNAGVLVTGTDPSPYVFYVLNNRPDVRLTDVKFVNPLAPTNINVATLNRYPAAYTLNQTVTPDMAAYWEVSLNSVSDSELAQYNVLYLRADNVTFGPATNEKLRRFVDNGGQLIVEYGTSVTPVTTGRGLFTGTDPATTTTPSDLLLPAAGTALLQHPILSQPYFFTPADILSLGQYGNSITGTAESGNWFSPVLKNTTGSVVTAAQMGAGQVVVSDLNIGPLVGPGNGAYFLAQTAAPAPAPTPFYTNFTGAPAADLKLLTNILSWAQTHPNENKTSHGSASSAGLSSFSPAWQYPATGTGTPIPPPAATVWGNFVFAVDATGFLSAFDAYPSENLTGGATADDGTVADPAGASYDQIWTLSVGTGASAPTVAAWGGANYVFVEKKDGSVLALNAVTGAAAPFTLTAPTPSTSYPAASYPQGSITNAPAPTYYDGRLYAGQPDGTLHVYDLNEVSGGFVTGVLVPLNAPVTTGPSEYVTGSPSVGLITSGDSNVLAALVPTNYSLHTVLLGARNEPLILFSQNNATAGYSISRSQRYGSNGSGDLANIFADLNALPTLQAYDLNGLIAAGVTANSTAPNPQDPLFSITGSSAYFTDWNMDFPASIFAGTGTPLNPVNLNFISATSYNALQNGGTPNAALALSAPAIDRHGDYYYTETMASGAAGSGVTNSYLIGANAGLLAGSVHLKFRFLLPQVGTTTLKDADDVEYAPLAGFQFKGAPVVDDQGNVYAAATNGTQATVLCFRANQQISAVVPAANEPPSPTPPIDLTQYTITQTPEDGSSGINTITANPDGSRRYGQYITAPPTTDALGNLTAPSTLLFFDFGKQDRGIKQVAGSLTEPQPVIAADPGNPVNTVLLPMHTNMAWYVQRFTVTGNVTGLTQVGNSLLLTDGTNLYRVSTKPQIGAGRVVSAAPFKTPIGVGTVGVGAVGSPPSVGGSVLVVSGAGGIAARTRQVTVIADSRRILGVDGDGGAAWAVDATTRTDTAANVTTKVPFSHPTSLSPFAVNDYLVADTGNNRCVRFDSAGNVQWELTRFADPSGLLGTGQPSTLSQPSSVVVRIVADPSANNVGGSYVYYLVADSGNDRIVEVCDRIGKLGGIFVDPVAAHNEPVLDHQLTWASHTGDRDGRSYRYGSAAYYLNPTAASKLSIAATVTNTRLGPLTANGLGPVSGDAAGGSLVVFNYPVTPQAFSANAATDLVYTTAGFYTASGPLGIATTKYTPYTIRNPRFLQLFTSPTAAAPATGVPAFDFLYTDDNGAFDLAYDAARKAFIATADRLQFKVTDYQAMTAPAFGVGVAGAVTRNRTGLPFAPTCVQGLGTDSQGTGANATTTRRYLITQSYSQGELGGPPGAAGKLGGEVFEIDVSNASGTATVTAPGGFAGAATLSHPDLTGPLTQPTFAVRLP